MRSTKVSNWLKSNYESWTEELNIIDRLLNYAISERKNISFMLIDWLRQLMTLALLANRAGMQGTPTRESEWSLNRKEFRRLCQEMRLKQASNVNLNGLTVVCELESVIKQEARATPMLGKLFHQYLSNREEFLWETTMEKFIGSEWLKANLHITPNRPACLSKEQA